MNMPTSVDSQAFKTEIWNELDSLPWNNSVNISIQISDAAFERMMNDENFKNQMMTIMHEEASGCRAPFVSACLTVIDETGYSGFTYNDHIMGNDAFRTHSSHNDSFYVRQSRAQEIDEAWSKLQQIRKSRHEVYEEEYLNRLIEQKAQFYNEQSENMWFE